MDIQIRAFFTSFTSRCIQAADCSKMEDALVKARVYVKEQEKTIESFLDKFCLGWEATSQGLTITTKPITHELFIDKEPSQQYIYGGVFPRDKREKKYAAGSAVILIPMESLDPIIRFTNDEFIHGHLYAEGGKISCWGKYQSIGRTVLAEGPMAALSSMYGFCKHSRYGTHLKSEVPGAVNV